MECICYLPVDTLPHVPGIVIVFIKMLFCRVVVDLIDDRCFAVGVSVHLLLVRDMCVLRMMVDRYTAMSSF